MFVKTPPMGWNSWNTFGAEINEQIVKETADKIIELGLDKIGYEYVIIDDCWSLRERSEDGKLVPNPEKFPNGMKAVSDYVHSKGLKFGMYSCAGTMTCARFPGSLEHEFVDAQTFADWGVDYLKYDYCYKPTHIPGELLYRRMALALRATGRDILFNACNWGFEDSGTWMRANGIDMYRSTGDIEDNWNSIKNLANLQRGKEFHGAPGCFNDMDMLVVGMNGKGNVGLGGCTEEEYKTHMSLWSILGSPLIIGADLRAIDEAGLAILKNEDIIAINQDPAGRPPYFVQDWIAPDNRFTYVKPLENGDYAIGMFNYTEEKGLVTMLLWDMGITQDSNVKISLKDLWSGEELGVFKNRLEMEVESHGCRMFRAKLVK